MKYYHGTKSIIEEFTEKGNGKHGEGFYFTPDKNEAFYFAKTLSGRGENSEPRVYTVSLKFSNLFNTMNKEHCTLVMESLGLSYKEPKSAGGAEEHYHHLLKQIKKQGLGDNINQFIANAGFDGLIYDLMEHVIVFNPEQIIIESVETVDP